MHIIIGLGNPGDKYRSTRHNVGFETMDKLSYDCSIPMKKNTRLRAVVGEGRLGSHKIMLVQPTTYMNRSGEAVQAILNFYKLTPADIIVVYDDVSLSLGEIRVRERGSAGGQKGMVDIIAALGTDEFPRVRIGVGEKPDGWTLSNYVLSRFHKAEWDAMIQGVTKAGDAVKLILDNGMMDAMNKFNKKIPKPKPEKSVISIAQPVTSPVQPEPMPQSALNKLRSMFK